MRLTIGFLMLFISVCGAEGQTIFGKRINLNKDGKYAGVYIQPLAEEGFLLVGQVNTGLLAGSGEWELVHFDTTFQPQGEPLRISTDYKGYIGDMSYHDGKAYILIESEFKLVKLNREFKVFQMDLTNHSLKTLTATANKARIHPNLQVVGNRAFLLSVKYKRELLVQEFNFESMTTSDQEMTIYEGKVKDLPSAWHVNPENLSAVAVYKTYSWEFKNGKGMPGTLPIVSGDLKEELHNVGAYALEEGDYLYMGSYRFKKGESGLVLIRRKGRDMDYERRYDLRSLAELQRFLRAHSDDKELKQFIKRFGDGAEPFDQNEMAFHEVSRWGDTVLFSVELRGPIFQTNSITNAATGNPMSTSINVVGFYHPFTLLMQFDLRNGDLLWHGVAKVDGKEIIDMIGPYDNVSNRLFSRYFLDKEKNELIVLVKNDNNEIIKTTFDLSGANPPRKMTAAIRATKASKSSAEVKHDANAYIFPMYGNRMLLLGREKSGGLLDGTKEYFVQELIAN